MRPFLAAILLVALSACSGTEGAGTSGPDVRPSARRLAATADSLAAASTTTPRLALLERSLRRSGLTPLRDGLGAGQYQLDLGVPIVGGFVPGRHPLGRTELVVVGTRRTGPGVAVVLEAARVLAERSRWIAHPERSIQVTLWPAGDGARLALRSAVWERDAIRALVVVGEEGPSYVDGIPVARLGTDAEPHALAEALVARVLFEARYVPPSAPPPAP